MTYSLQQPPLPKVPLEHCTDEERKISGKCWDLKKVQEGLNAGTLTLSLTTKASTDAALELRWRSADAVNFLKCLEARHYNGSEWCAPPKDGNKFGPLPADSYLMGFDRLSCAESPKRQPYVYMKFAVREDVREVLVFSLHPTRH
jgi:hypothetical protein